MRLLAFGHASKTHIAGPALKVRPSCGWQGSKYGGLLLLRQPASAGLNRLYFSSIWQHMLLVFEQGLEAGGCLCTSADPLQRCPRLCILQARLLGCLAPSRPAWPSAQRCSWRTMQSVAASAGFPTPAERNRQLAQRLKVSRWLATAYPSVWLGAALPRLFIPLPQPTRSSGSTGHACRRRWRLQGRTSRRMNG